MNENSEHVFTNWHIFEIMDNLLKSWTVMTHNRNDYNASFISLYYYCKKTVSCHLTWLSKYSSLWSIHFRIRSNHLSSTSISSADENRCHRNLSLKYGNKKKKKKKLGAKSGLYGGFSYTLTWSFECSNSRLLIACIVLVKTALGSFLYFT